MATYQEQSVGMNIRDLGDLYLKDIVLASRILSCVLPMAVREEENVLGYAPDG